MQITLAEATDCAQRDRTESEWSDGVQTFMWMTEENIVEMTFDKNHFLEAILPPSNLNRVYKALIRNKGCGIINHGLFEANEEGTPQDGPLNLLLSNIMLNELDKELERRGHPFVQYAMTR